MVKRTERNKLTPLGQNVWKIVTYSVILLKWLSSVPDSYTMQVDAGDVRGPVDAGGWKVALLERLHFFREPGYLGVGMTKVYEPILIPIDVNIFLDP